jgi:hypothetical protein
MGSLEPFAEPLYSESAISGLEFVVSGAGPFFRVTILYAKHELIETNMTCSEATTDGWERKAHRHRSALTQPIQRARRAHEDYRYDRVAAEEQVPEQDIVDRTGADGV